MEDVFVKADALAKAVGECEDYKNLLAAGEKLAAEESTRKNVRDYLILQAKLAYAQSMGDKPVKKKIEELNRLAEAGEIYQIIQNSMAEGMSILDQ